MKIGVDVGGTNTDAVVLGVNGVLGWRKTPTTADVYSGIVSAITEAIADAAVDSADVDCVMIGTTQFTNAVIQRRFLLPVGIIRLALPATSAIPPLTDWPDDLIAEVGRNTHLVAEFFMQHLYDGDTASNTLGWRWVAGVQTQGKHYLASEWNINKFTNNRFQNIKLNENASPKISNKSYPLIKRNFNNPQNLEEKNLLIFENNLSFEITDFQENNFKKIYIISNKNENRSIKLSEKLVKFKSLLMKDQEQRLKDKSIDCEVIDISEVKNIENYYSLYPTVGENLDYLNSNNIKMVFLYRNLDQLSWQYCNKGFFNFKNYIPKIISSFK